MLLNLLPDFFAVLASTDRVAAYQRYFDAHRPLLEAYWQNYVVDPDGPHFLDVVRAALRADRADLRAMLERTDVVALARDAEARCAALLEADVDVQVVLMVGVGVGLDARSKCCASFVLHDLVGRVFLCEGQICAT